MKTTISIPDDTFHASEALARRLRMSRSKLYAKAVAEYLRRQQLQDVTGRRNAVYETEDSSLDPALGKIQRASLRKERW